MSVARVLVLAILFLGWSQPVQATGTISCVSEEGASVDIGIGTLPILSVFSAYIQFSGQSWSTDEGQIGAVQAFGDDDTVRVDFTDDNVNEIIARLRLFRVLEGNDFAMAGTLQIVGTGAFAVTCIGP